MPQQYYITHILSIFIYFNIKLSFGINHPCDYKDTVDLTGYQPLPNGSYLYEETLIPASLVSNYEYKIVIANARGCVCKLKPCVSICCPLNEVYQEVCVPSNNSLNEIMQITTEKGIFEKNVIKQFAVQIWRPCHEMFHLNPYLYEEDNFVLFENGTLLRLFDKQYLGRNQFCLSPLENPAQVLVPLNCFLSEEEVEARSSLFFPSTMLVSVPFMLITVFVYLYLPELRTIHGKSFCCYLLSLAFGYFLLGGIALYSWRKLSDEMCTFIGYVIYYTFIASFLWLSVLSFDLFKNVSGSNTQNGKKMFCLYSVFAWGLALIFLLLTYLAQNTNFIPNRWKPGIGIDYCYLNVKTNWSALIYFFIPFIIILIFNITTFIFTARKIASFQNKISSSGQSAKRDLFLTYFRLFVLMGIAWTSEFISFVIGSESKLSFIFLFTDFINAIHGIIIFILFVLRKKIWQSILERLTSRRGGADFTVVEDLSDRM